MIKLKKILNEKTLYHGTTIRNAKEIEKHGLIPQVGKFVKNAYAGSGYEDEHYQDLIFASDKQQLDKSVSAATAQIAAEMGKDFHEVTDEEFYRNAAILKIYDGDAFFNRMPNDDNADYGNHPPTVEPGDYYSQEGIIPDEILTGQRMIRLLRRYGLWPRAYMFSQDERTLRGELVRLAIEYHTDTPKEKILKAVMDLPKQYLLDKVRTYKKALGYSGEI